MALLASCPTIKGEFRIWAWSSKTEKLSGFRDGNDGNEGVGAPNTTGALYWSRNGKVVQFIEGYLSLSEKDLWLAKFEFGMLRNCRYRANCFSLLQKICVVSPWTDTEG